MSCHFRGVQWIRRGKIFEWKRGRDPYFVNVMFFFFQPDPAYSRFVGVLEEPIGRSEEY